MNANTNGTGHANVHVIVGGQFGSEAKGAVTAWLARQIINRDKNCAIVRVAGPNAGHTAYDDNGIAHALRQIPVAMVVSPKIRGYIGAGSEVDLPVVLEEVQRLEGYGHNIRSRLIVDDQATLLTDAHHQIETNLGLHGKLGSTGKGIGAARADRIMRSAPVWSELCDAYLDNSDLLRKLLRVYWPTADQDAMFKLVGDLQHGNTSKMLANELLFGHDVLIEGTQGYGLGLHAGHYPKCTSSDTRAIDFLAMAGISPWAPEVKDVHVWVALRVHPIRVAGNSGPLKDETTWADLGLETELTTVTKLPRRVGQWDGDLAREALVANGGPGPNVHACITMLDQTQPKLKGRNGAYDRSINNLRHAVGPLWFFGRELRTQPIYFGTGPNSVLWSDTQLDEILTDRAADTKEK